MLEFSRINGFLSWISPNFARKALFHIVATFWQRFHVKMHNISLWCMRISQCFRFLLNLSEFFSCSFSFLFFRLSYSRYFLLFTSFFLAEKVWRKSLENPEKETMINYRCIGLFEHRFCTQNWSRFSLISSVRMQPIFKMNSSVERSIPALSAVCHKNPLTGELMTSQVVQWPHLQKSA